MRDERRAAFEVQRRLLGEPPVMSGVEIAVGWSPHSEVGGDFYDFVVLGDDTLGLTLGDVSGKGLDAALLMVFALAEVRVGLRSHLRLARLMSQLDESLRRHSTSNRYAEVITGYYACRSRRFSFVQAGSIFPMVFQRSSRRLFLGGRLRNRVPGVAIPGQPDASYLEDILQLEAGDFLILMTDGLSERKCKDGQAVVRRDALDAWTAPVIRDLCCSLPDADAAGLKIAILQTLQPSGDLRFDDETLIVLRPT